MRITESRLRQVIREVLSEMNNMSGPVGRYTPQNIADMQAQGQYVPQGKEGQFLSMGGGHEDYDEVTEIIQDLLSIKDLGKRHTAFQSNMQSMPKDHIDYIKSRVGLTSKQDRVERDLDL